MIAKTAPDRLGSYAQERGWRNLRLLSSRNNTFNRDYHAETPDGGQLPVLNVFYRGKDGIHHRWTSELTFTSGSISSLDAVWPIFGALDVTPDGRGDLAAYPNLQYYSIRKPSNPRPVSVRAAPQRGRPVASRPTLGG